MSASLAASLASLPEKDRQATLDGLSNSEIAALEYDWRFWARPNQLPPLGSWTYWLLLAGRGFGKTRCGAEWVRETKEICARIALVAPTAADVRDVMVEGESGILACSPPWDRPLYEPSKRRLTWQNGAMATTYSADEPERLRGPQHAAAWCDELAAWRYPDAFDQLMFGLRLGADPRCVITTTPKPIKLVRDLLTNPRCIPTRGSTFDNRANLAPAFLSSIVRKYENTRLGRQELFAEMLEDVPGALWQRGVIDDTRVALKPDMQRIVVAIDPATTSGENSDETGIIVAGRGVDGRGYVLEDLTFRGTPNEWATVAVGAFQRWRADRIVAETNQGGQMVEANLRTVASMIPFTGVHAKRGKVLRAEPVSALYEQRRISHAGNFSSLEDQMCSFTADFDGSKAGYSPDRVDALVYALTELMVEPEARPPRSQPFSLMAR